MLNLLTNIQQPLFIKGLFQSYIFCINYTILREEKCYFYHFVIF